MTKAQQERLDDLKAEYEEVRTNLAEAKSYATMLRRDHSEAKRKGLPTREQLWKDLQLQRFIVHRLQEDRNRLGAQISNYPALMRALAHADKLQAQMQLPGVS